MSNPTAFRLTPVTRWERSIGGWLAMLKCGHTAFRYGAEPRLKQVKCYACPAKAAWAARLMEEHASQAS